MASYTNLTSLSGLSVGDVITYNTATAINMDGYIVQIELYGQKKGTYYAAGGYTKFTLDPSNLRYFYWTPNYGSSLMYDKTQSSTSRTIYYRIGVAGNGGQGSNGGKGGGSSGGDGSNSSSTYSGQTATGRGGKGGTQSAGGDRGTGSGNLSTASGIAGKFGAGGAGSTTLAGGDGWYGGGGGGYGKAGISSSGTYNTEAYGGGGGGSGFVIGQSTTTYPSGYMDDNASDIAALEAAVSNAILTNGDSTESTCKMVVTILQTQSTVTEVAISITSLPNKLTYTVGDENPDPRGLAVDLVYSDSTTQPLSSSQYTLTWPTFGTAGQKTVTITYGQFTTQFTITVVDPPGHYVYYCRGQFDPTSITTNPTDKWEIWEDPNTGISYYNFNNMVSTVCEKNTQTDIWEGTCAITFYGSISPGTYSCTFEDWSEDGAEGNIRAWISGGVASSQSSFSNNQVVVTATASWIRFVISLAAEESTDYFDVLVGMHLNNANPGFSKCEVHYYDGTQFIKCEPLYYDGTDWQTL